MRDRGSTVRRLLLLAVIVGLLATGAVVGGARLLDAEPPAQTPVSSTVPSVARAAAPLVAVGGTAPTAAGLRAALQPVLAAPSLGRSVGIQVVDAVTGRELYGVRADASGAPASTAKLVTAVAALQALGPDAVLRTRAVLGAAGDARTVVLVGGGDATLAGPRAPPWSYPTQARLTDLAAVTARRLRERGTTTVHLAVDDRLYSGPTTGPGWKPNYVPEGSVSPVTALSLDGGRLAPDSDFRTPDTRAADPPLTTGRVFASLLADRGIRVLGGVERGRPSTDARPLATVSSPPIAGLVVGMLQRSDNEVAESLFRQVARAEKQQPTFAGGAAAVRSVLDGLGVDVGGLQVVDGSGLSTRDRVTPRALVGLLRVVTDPRRTLFRPVLEGLPVAAFSGTLAERFRLGTDDQIAGPGAGMVRAKTGTLSGVSSLAGLTVDADGRLLLFALLADRVPLGGLTAAQSALDDIAARLAACGCR